MSDQWLTADSALFVGSNKLEAVKKSLGVADVEVLNAEIAGVLASNNDIRRRLFGSVFLSAIGIEWPEKPPERETWYISSAMVGGFFASEQVVGWTHWMGSVATRLREGFERGEYPQELLCGPEGKQKVHKVGPLVLYHSRDGRMVDSDFLDGSTVKQAEAAPTLDDFEGQEFQGDQDSGSSLKSIVTTFDIQQDDIVRGPKGGAFLYYGGPGTGKTTLALHRIPYLIIDQELEADDLGGEDKKSRKTNAEPFFTVGKTLVLVWKEHLVNYLRESIAKLNIGFPFPAENVGHIDRWVTERLRPYVKFGGKSWRLNHDPNPRVESLKSQLNEEDLQRFLDTDHTFVVSARNTFASAMPKSFSELLSKRLDDLRELKPDPFSYPTPEFSVASFERAATFILDRLPETNESRFSEMQNNEIRKLRHDVQEARKAAFAQISRYDEILFEFYRSDVVLERLPSLEREAFLTAIAKQYEEKTLSRADTYLLIWIVDLITEGAKSKQGAIRPLPEYTHIVVDEAQYYEPLLLRLFGRLVALPTGVLTIVGDLEQRFSHAGGVGDWKEIGIEFPPDRRCHLKYNYRWTPELFEFLQQFHKAFRIQEELTCPYKFRIDGGYPPEIRRYESLFEEHEAIADRITDLKDYEVSQAWTYAIIVPERLKEEAQGELIPALQSRFIEAQWVEGNNVSPTVDRVVVCGFDSIVGLEFDCVFIMGVDLNQSRVNDGPDLGLWVGVTRAQKFLHISLRGEPSLLDTSRFAKFQTAPSVNSDAIESPEVISEPTSSLSYAEVSKSGWFILAAWAKEHDLLTGWERQFCYSQGVRVRSRRDASDKEAAKAQEILDRAIRAGFVP